MITITVSLLCISHNLSLYFSFKVETFVMNDSWKRSCSSTTIIYYHRATTPIHQSSPLLSINLIFIYVLSLADAVLIELQTRWVSMYFQWVSLGFNASVTTCHSFYLQTDLCGIKWRVYTWQQPQQHTPTSNSSNNPSDPLEDPVLSSYARCLSADVLCVWRRSWRRPQQQHSFLDPIQQDSGTRPPPTSLKLSAKELWVFWYGDEPDLSSLVAPELCKSGELINLSLTCYKVGGHSATCIYCFKKRKGSWIY